MTQSRNFTPPEILKILGNLPEELADLALELRSHILSLAADAVEEIHEKYFSYYHRGKGGPASAGICQIGLLPDHIHHVFIHGVFLSDPGRLLQGDSAV